MHEDHFTRGAESQVRLAREVFPVKAVAVIRDDARAGEGYPPALRARSKRRRRQGSR
jgi:hypothetical protein